MFSLVSYFCGCGGLDLGFRGDFEYKGHYYPHQPFNLLADLNEQQNYHRCNQWPAGLYYAVQYFGIICSLRYILQVFLTIHHAGYHQESGDKIPQWNGE